MVSVRVIPRSKSIKEVDTEFELTVPVLKLAEIISKSCKLGEERIRITFNDAKGNRTPMDKSKSLEENGIDTSGKQVTLYSKDLGPQIGWRTVFVIEYLGPFLIHPFFYVLSSFYGSGNFERTQTQKLAFLMVMLHFLKRILETIFVHRFSNATMPLFNIFKNSSHYWILSGVNLAFFIYTPPTWNSSTMKFVFHVNSLSCATNYLLFGLWVFAELSNFKTHLTLSTLRQGSDKKRYAIPYGYGFNWVSYPNYFFETLAWFFYALMVGNWAAWLFLAVSTTQMWIWAVKKHKRYLKTFGDDYKKLKRKAFIPFVV